jgi:hypothetical protein
MTTWKKCDGCGVALTNDNDSEARIIPDASGQRV